MTCLLIALLLAVPGDFPFSPESPTGVYPQLIYKDGSPRLWVYNARKDPVVINVRPVGPTTATLTRRVDSQAVREIDPEFLDPDFPVEVSVDDNPLGILNSLEGSVPDMLGTEYLLPGAAEGEVGEMLWLQAAGLTFRSGETAELTLWAFQGIEDFTFYTALVSNPDHEWNQHILVPSNVESTTLKVTEKEGNFTIHAATPIRDEWMHRITLKVKMPPVSEPTVFSLGANPRSLFLLLVTP